jgi:HEPN domain-containing protein
MSDIEQARSLMRLARRDFNALLGMEHSALFVDEIFGYHAQQAVEKALKAWLCSQDMLYPLTHELSRLLTLIESTGMDVEALWPLARFTPYAVQGRYEELAGNQGEPLNRASIIAEVRVLFDCVDAGVAEPGDDVN